MQAGLAVAQTRRIAGALAKGEIALAQIHNCILVGKLEDRALQRLASASELVKTNFNPNQPRAPAGIPDDGQWTDAGGSKQTPEPPQADAAAHDEVSPGSDAGPICPSRNGKGHSSIEY